MYDSSSDLKGFYNKCVRLSKDDKDKLAGYRDSNIKRLESGLAKDSNPMPEYINQGSYAMHTINQHPSNDYDIDLGVIFNKDDLIGARGADMTALDARKMVLQAMKDDRFTKEPQIRVNCIRVFYNEGHHVDMPVYRKTDDKLELASSDWYQSDPAAVTKWFCDNVDKKSPDTENGKQMRRVVRLIKYWSRSRFSWNMPSGFIISVLVDECYNAVENRDDEALYKTLLKISERLKKSTDVFHPIFPDINLSEGKEHKIEEFIGQIEENVLPCFEDIFDPESTRQTVLKAWKAIFDHEFFKDLLESKSREFVSVVPTKPVSKDGNNRYARNA
ncbi:MAG: hypothetical protein DKM50_04310 [Candidatus Margulisiibacteriota bacterium]|nr:MAG: hypothetical protein DKM50_04310 [Candidatus Margulisiibacteriota bacterium]